MATASPFRTERGDATVKKRKKALPFLVAAVAVVLVAAVGVTLAYMFKKVDRVNTFEPATVTCTVHEKLDGAEHTNGSQTGSEKSDIRVENTGNVDAFLRVRLISYWVNANGEVVGVPSEMPEVALDTTHWSAGADNTYYYKTPVKPGEQTAPLSGTAISLRETQTTDGDNIYTVYQVVEVFAEAIQANPTDAVKNAWGVTVENDQIS